MIEVKQLFLLLVMCTGGSCIVAGKHSGLLSYTDAAGKERSIYRQAEWGIKRAEILKKMQLVMGNLPQRVNLPPMNIQYIDSSAGNGYTRYTINFTVAENEHLPALLYVPVQAGIIKKLPAMLALHETGMPGKKIVDGQTGKDDQAYAKELAERGFIVIAPDYPGFGDLKEYNFQTDRYVSGTMKSIFDGIRCVDLLQQRPDVDPDRIGAIGHSLGGHTAMFTAAFDTRLKVIVSSCGWTLMHDYFNGDTLTAQKNGGKLWPWAQERYMPFIRDKYDLDPDKIPFDFDEVIAAIAPRAFFSNSPLHDMNFNIKGVQEGILNASKVYDFLGAKQHLRVRYPDSDHYFPQEIRTEAYGFIDSIFHHYPVHAE